MRRTLPFALQLGFLSGLTIESDFFIASPVSLFGLFSADVGHLSPQSGPDSPVTGFGVTVGVTVAQESVGVLSAEPALAFTPAETASFQIQVSLSVVAGETGWRLAMQEPPNSSVRSVPPVAACIAFV